MGIASPYCAMSYIIALIITICNGALAGLAYIVPADEGFARPAKRQLLDGAIVDAAKISGAGNKSTLDLCRPRRCDSADRVLRPCTSAAKQTG